MTTTMDKQMCDPRGTAWRRDVPRAEPCPKCGQAMLPVTTGNAFEAYTCPKCGHEVPGD